MHTSPLDQPGTGDAGGMNVYIERTLRALLLAYPQLSVEVFTLNQSAHPRQVHPLSERASVHFVDIPAARSASKSELPQYISEFSRQVQAIARRTPDIIHAHYWLSGMVALEYAQQTPIVQTMHTTAATKDLRAQPGESLEPAIRYESEQKLVQQVQALVVNTDIEQQQMMEFYNADPTKISVVEPGVDIGIFKPCVNETAENKESAHRARVVFAGRPQPLKGPHLLVEALALLPRDLEVYLDIVGRSGTDYEQGLISRAKELGLEAKVRSLPSQPPRELARTFRAADVVACPSSSETFGLVALEAQACGTPVLATRADGLISAVDDGRTGLLVSPRTPAAWALAIEALVRNPERRQLLGHRGALRASTKTWNRTAEYLMSLYQKISDHPAPTTP